MWLQNLKPQPHQINFLGYQKGANFINQVVMTVNGWQVTRQTTKTKSPNKIYKAQRD
jgi:hypothetical protein